MGTNDEQWISECFERLYRPLFFHLQNKLCDPSPTNPLKQEIEDSIQDAFLYIWKHRSKYRNYENIDALLYVVANHRFINHLRKHVARKKRESACVSDCAGHEPDLLHRELVDDYLAQIADALGDEKMKLMIDYFDKSISNDELAAQLGIKKPALRMRVLRNVYKMRDVLKFHALTMFAFALLERVMGGGA